LIETSTTETATTTTTQEPLEEGQATDERMGDIENPTTSTTTQGPVGCGPRENDNQGENSFAGQSGVETFDEPEELDDTTTSTTTDLASVGSETSTSSTTTTTLHARAFWEARDAELRRSQTSTTTSTRRPQDLPDQGRIEVIVDPAEATQGPTRDPSDTESGGPKGSSTTTVAFENILKVVVRDDIHPQHQDTLSRRKGISWNDTLDFAWEVAQPLLKRHFRGKVVQQKQDSNAVIIAVLISFIAFIVVICQQFTINHQRHH
jgi:hypothetical protein